MLKIKDGFAIHLADQDLGQAVVTMVNVNER